MTIAVIPATALLLFAGGCALWAQPSMHRESKDYLDAVHGLSLSELLTRAREAYPAILAAREQVDAARGARLQAGLKTNPAIDVSYLSGPLVRNGGEDQFSVQLSLLVERRGKRAARMNLANQEIDVRKGQESVETRRIDYEVKRAYYDALAAVQILRTTESLIALTERNLTLIRARVQHGESAELEGRLARVEVERLRATLPAAGAAVEQALLQLATWTQLPAAGIRLKTGNPPPPEGLSPEKLLPLALSARPELQVLEAEWKRAEADASLARQQARPDPTWYVQFNKGRSQNAQFGVDAAGLPARVRDNDNILGGGVSIPLAIRDRNQGRIAAADAEARAASLRRDAGRRLVEGEVRRALLEWQSSRESARRLSANVLGQTRENLKTIQASYELGELRLLDVLQEQRRLLELEREYAGLLRAASFALVELERSMGSDLSTQGAVQ
ncbi:MAG TPA: TolC family protein [Bryobacteraceae bacterium]|nr:TolC family protein [Bryobacteraceae bacterium]